MISWDAVPDESGVWSAEPVPGTVAWLDPGKTTGWASWSPTAGEFESGELLFLPLGEWLRQRLSVTVWLGWEAYTVRPGGARIKFQPDSLEVIGMTRWLAYSQYARVLPPQQPSARQTGLLHLKSAGWHRPGLGHANDAAGHLLAFLLAYRLAPPELMGKIRET
jgi:hypothetical protein